MATGKKMAKGRTPLARYRVPFNKHKYQDLSDSPKQGAMTVRAESARDAGYIVAKKRTGTDVSGVRTPRGARYYIGNIHYGDVRKAH